MMSTNVDEESGSLPITKPTEAAISSPPSSKSSPSAKMTIAANNDQHYASVCRIEVAKVEWHFLHPWQRCSQTNSVGSGFIIDGERLLTNAHVVKAGVDIRVRPHGSTKRYPAQIDVYAPDVDLAILKIKGEKEHADFFGHDTSSTTTGDSNNHERGGTNGKSKRLRKSLALEFATELPNLQESVRVVGFPTGGKTLCITEGVVSRIDLHDRGLVIQVDSAINGGNSGGPAFNSKGQVTG